MVPSVLDTLPIVIVFIFVRTHLMTARTAGAVKG